MADDGRKGWGERIGGWFGASGKKYPVQQPPDESLGPARAGEVRPPWIEYPGFGPGDGFWRQSGEVWMFDVWEPYYKGLTAEEQAAYKVHWRVPEEWENFYFDPEWQKLGEDDEES